MAEETINSSLKTLFQEHDYERTYKELTIVTRTVGDVIDFYIAKQNVPRHISIEDKHYWKQLNNSTGAGESPAPTPGEGSEPTPGGEPNFYLFPPYTAEGQTAPFYRFDSEDGSVEISGVAIQCDLADSAQPDISRCKIENTEYPVVISLFDDDIPPFNENTVHMYYQALPITQEIIDQVSSILGIQIDLTNGSHFLNIITVFKSEEIHGDFTLTLYDSNGNSSSVTVTEYTESSDEPDEPDYLCFTANKAGATLALNGAYFNYSGDDFAVEYSSDRTNWNNLSISKTEADEGIYLAISDTITFQNIGDKVYFRGNNTNGTTHIISDDPPSFMAFKFVGGNNTQTEDNEFSVSGDLQTLVKEDGTDKEHGCFGMPEGGGLFTNVNFLDSDASGILITSAPDLTATNLGNLTYAELFSGQSLLAHPATIPEFTLEDLPNPGYAGCFYEMYAGTGLTEPADFSHIVINEQTSSDELVKIENFVGIYEATDFDITSDNGETLNGFEGIQFPITFIEDNETEELSSLQFAYILGNTNGFRLAHIYLNAGNKGDIIPSDGYIGSHEEPTYIVPLNESLNVTLTADPREGYHFVKWQTSNDEGSTWTDIQNAINTTYTSTLTQPGDYYYKAVFEQD